MKRLLFLSTLIAALPAHAAIYTVGNDVSCSTNNLQAAINTAQNNAGPDEIRVHKDYAPVPASFSIGSQDLTIIGGFANCTDAAPQTGVNTILSGQGGSSRVFNIQGSGVRVLRQLSIIRGNAANSDYGGGIRFSGTHELRLYDVIISSNSADHGGGIAFHGGANSFPAVLTLGKGTLIMQNTARTGNGGGISMTGNAKLEMIEPDTWIFGNAADGTDSRGGGLFLSGPATAVIRSPGFLSGAAFQDNTADLGGGIAMYCPDESSMTLVDIAAFSTTQPVAFRGNRARKEGGALHLAPYVDTFNNSASVIVNASGVEMIDNKARNGAAVYLGENSGGIGGINVVGTYFWALGPGGGAPLMRFAGNRAVDVNDAPTGGSTFYVSRKSDLAVRYAEIAGNSGAHVVDASADNVTVAINRVLIAGNTLTSTVIERGEGDNDPLRVTNTTIAGNAMPAGVPVIRRAGADNADNVAYNTIWQPGNPALSYGQIPIPLNIEPNMYWNAVNARGDLPDLPGTNAPRLVRFIDPQHGDYRHRIGSEAVDRAPEVTAAEGGDLDARPYDVAQPIYAGIRNMRDPGAYERQIADPWIDNGHFLGNTWQWLPGDPTATATYQAATAAGSPGGSVQIAVPAIVNGPIRRTGLRYCFNVPAAGTYQLTGKGKSNGTIIMPGDKPIIQWRLRNNSDDCSGQVDAQGDVLLGTGSSFQGPFAPASITVLPSAFTPQTTIEIRLDVEGRLVGAAYAASFDAIEISGQSDVIFRNGFDGT